MPPARCAAPDCAPARSPSRSQPQASSAMYGRLPAPTRAARALRAAGPLAGAASAPAPVERLLLAPPGDRHAAGFRERSADLLRRGDCFLVAGAAQRAHVAGQLLLAGRLAPEALLEPPLLE